MQHQGIFIVIVLVLGATSSPTRAKINEIQRCTPNKTSLEQMLSCRPPSNQLSTRERTAFIENPASASSSRFLDSIVRKLNSPAPPPKRNRNRWVFPVPGKMGKLGHRQKFGASRLGIRPRQCGRGHCGIDLARHTGTPVFAARRGKVVKVGRRRYSKAGLWIEIKHDRGFRTRYLHLDSIAKHLRVGSKLKAGQMIGRVGNTGSSSHGSHLHFEVFKKRKRKAKKYLDPGLMFRAQWTGRNI